MRLGLCVGGLVATGVVVFSPFALGRGGGGGGGQGSAGYGGHYGNPFWSPGYPGPGSYDTGYTYTYTPSAEQQSTAQKRVNDYLVAVRKGHDAPRPIVISRWKRSGPRKHSAKRI